MTIPYIHRCGYLIRVFLLLLFYLFNRHHNWSSLYHQAQILLSSHTHTYIYIVLLQPMVLIASTKFTRRLSRSFSSFLSLSLYLFFSAHCPLSRHRHKNGWTMVHFLFSIDNDSLEQYSSRSLLIGIIDETWYIVFPDLRFCFVHFQSSFSFASHY